MEFSRKISAGDSGNLGASLPVVNDASSAVPSVQTVDLCDQYPPGQYHLKVSRLTSDKDYPYVRKYFLDLGKVLAMERLKADNFYSVYVRFEKDSDADKIIDSKVGRSLKIGAVEFFPQSTKSYRTYKAKKALELIGLNCVDETSNKLTPKDQKTGNKIDAAGDRTSVGGQIVPQPAPVIPTGPYIGQFHLSIRNIFAGQPKLQVDVTDFLNHYGTPSHIDFRNLRRNEGLGKGVVDAYVKYKDDQSANSLLDEVQAINIHSAWCNVRPTLEFTAYRNRDSTNRLKLSDPGLPANASPFKGKWHLRTGKFLVNDENLKSALRQFYQQYGTIARLSVAQSKHTGYMNEKSKYDAFVLFQDSSVAKRLLDAKMDFTYQWKQKHIIPSKEFKAYLDDVRSRFGSQAPTTDSDQSVATLTKLCFLDPTGADPNGYPGEYHVTFEPFSKSDCDMAGDSVLGFARKFGRVVKVQVQPFFAHHSFVGSVKVQKKPTFAQLRVNVRFASDRSANALLESGLKFCYKGRNMSIAATEDYHSYGTMNKEDY